MNNTIAFTPVKGKDEQIKEITNHQEGLIYFTTDSKKIYMPHENELLTMGGNSSVYYGTRQMADYEIFGNETEFNFLGQVKDAEGNIVYPTVDDLILNEPDGGFYRVVQAYSEGIIGKRIAVSGTGSGGGGNTGGGGLTGKEELSIIPLTP
jgi:hypothetical protein